VVKVTYGNPAKIKQMQSEIEMYELLLNLQGNVLPRLVFGGYLWSNFVFGIITIAYDEDLEDAGIENVSIELRLKALEYLKEIHKKKVLHNDFALRNVVLNRNRDDIKIIDLDHAVMCEDSKLFEEEIRIAKMVLQI
jgi:hypothetical protein